MLLAALFVIAKKLESIPKTTNEGVGWINDDLSSHSLKYYVDIKENDLPLAMVTLRCGFMWGFHFPFTWCTRKILSEILETNLIAKAFEIFLMIMKYFCI